MSITRQGLGWAALAVLGIVIAVALTWSVSRLAGRRIGLSSVSPAVVGGLVPPSPGHGRPAASARTTPTDATAGTTPGAPAGTAATAPTADDGGDAAGGGAQRDD
jgi:hypothetical protein